MFDVLLHMFSDFLFSRAVGNSMGQFGGSGVYSRNAVVREWLSLDHGEGEGGGGGGTGDRGGDRDGRRRRGRGRGRGRGAEADSYPDLENFLARDDEFD